MPITSGFTNHIETRLDEYLRSTEPDKMNLRRIAVELNVLPLMLDMGGCLALRPDGTIISFAWDDEQNYEVERDRRIRNIALFHASKKYPELQQLISARVSDDIDCPYCNGTGVDPMSTALRMNNINCYCGGLGWIPPD